MRILNVTQSYAPFFEFGGPPVKVRALAEGLAARGHAITVLTADWGLDRRLRQLPNESPAEHSALGRKRTAAGVAAIYLNNSLHYRAASWNPALPRFLRERLREFEIVHIIWAVRYARPSRGCRVPRTENPLCCRAYRHVSCRAYATCG